ncbi:MAG: cohesin domain-containing protein [Pigmentiphaga sp.]|uniref:cohesin domain-containing protein n=1 Tax=Pigmentiphaga sp. TaxID=1977564 RepID=UPI0029BB0946|nr:cohesin domain-containing protein [Pigmentiphaga sp.]MDX3904648.1 cohesin domain-containing protein [Pigmentiphaga sp.]
MPGTEGTIQLAVFAGTNPVGAAQATVTYDPAALEILGIEPVASGRVTPAVQWRKEGNVLHVVMVNGTSLNEPIGTVPLGNIRFKALGAVGRTTKLISKPTEILKPDAQAIPPGTEEHEGEVSFASAIPSARIAARGIVSTSPELVERARRMRPPGGIVTLQVVDASGRAQPVQVRIPPAAPARE